jgi:protocatechuate 3,4-dioxygenase beta subunit
MLKVLKLLCGLALATLLTVNVWAQGMFATLTGVVNDSSGAVVANAKVTLRDAGSGSARETVTDSAGYYTFASVPVGSYILTVEAPGFQGYVSGL